MSESGLTRESTYISNLVGGILVVAFFKDAQSRTHHLRRRCCAQFRLPIEGGEYACAIAQGETVRPGQLDERKRLQNLAKAKAYYTRSSRQR